MPGQEHEITELLHAWSNGDPRALPKLTPRVYDELHRIASTQFVHEAAGHTLQPTAVVNELFLDLVHRRRVRWEDRAHFFGFAANQIRRILVSYARRRKAGKRGGGARDLPLDDLPFTSNLMPDEILRLDAALADLKRFNPEGGRIVEMWFFGGLTRAEIALALGVSPSTVRDRWQAARAWLRRELRNS